MGVVYRAKDTRIGRTVALKMLPSELALDEERSRRFEREAQIVSSLSHPGIATLYEFDRDGDIAFLAMELVEGPTLRDLLRDGRVDPDQVIECGVQVAEALAAAHRAGITHRDLKPENVMRAESGYYKVLDFGVARVDTTQLQAGSTQTPTRTWATRAGALIGTVSYMSPEQVMGKPADARSDVFALGSVLYELATGVSAFRGPNEIATAHEIAYNDPHPMRGHHAEIPALLELVVGKCLAKEPADRYQSADDLAQDLRTLRRESTSGTRSGPRLLASQPMRARRRRMILVGLVAGTLTAALAGTVWKLLPQTEQAEQQSVDSNLIADRNARDLEVFMPPAAVAPPTALGRRGVSRGRGAMPAVAADGRPRVIVAFFENNSGDAEVDWLSRGLPEMLTTDLSRSEGLDVIATQRLHDLLEMAGKDSDTLDRSTSAELARWAGANLVISGSVFRVGERYRIDAQAYDTTTGTVRVAHKVEGDDVFGLVSELTEGLREGLQLAATGKGAPPTMTTHSEKALRVFLDGKSAYDNLDLDGAADRFEEALSIDPEFASARLGLAMSRELLDDPESARRLIEELQQEAERLPEAERLIAQGLHAYFVEEDLVAGNRHLGELLRKFPGQTDAFVWRSRGMAALSENPMGPTQQLRRALAQDPGNLHALVALARQLAELGAVDAARAMIDDARKNHPQARESLDRLAEEFAAP